MRVLVVLGMPMLVVLRMRVLVVLLMRMLVALRIRMLVALRMRMLVAFGVRMLLSCGPFFLIPYHPLVDTRQTTKPEQYRREDAQDAEAGANGQGYECSEKISQCSEEWPSVTHSSRILLECVHLWVEGRS